MARGSSSPGPKAAIASAPTLILIFLAVIFGLTAPSEGAKILAVLPHSGLTHFKVFEPLLKGLAARGHHVLVLSHFPQAKAPPRYEDISLVGAMPSLEATLELSYLEKMSPFGDFAEITRIGQASCEPTLALPEVAELIKSNRTFDIVLTEVFNTDCFLGFAYRYRPAPFIALSSSMLMPWGFGRIGAPLSSAWTPNLFLGLAPPLTLPQRVINAAFTLAANTYWRLFRLPAAQTVVERHFGPRVPSLATIAANTSLVLLNTHHSVHGPQPWPPGVLEIGGVHIDDPKPLSKDLEKWVAGAKDGVIIFSLGSMIRTSSLPLQRLEVLLSVLGDLKQRVILKWEEAPPKDLPSNIKMMSWIPQIDLLCHKKTRLFISHGGLLGLSEAAYCGVPVLGVPLYGDQRANMAALEARGTAKTLTYSAFRYPSRLNDAIQEILNNTKYSSAASQLMERFRDRPIPPLENAIWWIEFSLRRSKDANKDGLASLRGPTVNLSWWQEAQLDVAAVLIVLLAGASAAIIVAALKANTAYKTFIQSTDKKKKK